MADIIIKVLEPAEPHIGFALLTLDEVKLMLGIATVDTSNDPHLQQMIYWYSATVSQIANRVFAREKVRETWRCLGSRRIFLSHWPATEDDIESVEAPRGALVPGTDYEFEEASGKLELFGSRAEPIVVTYTGGYNLPDEAPDDLKNAASILIRHGRMAAQRDATAGIRSISHKDSRVMFFDPNQSSGGNAASGADGGSMEAIRAVHAMLYHYSRLEV
jgi:hypothetical protein